MFFSKFILMTKGPLAHVWISAHWNRKLTKQQIVATDIPVSAGAILEPDAPMALRLSGQLLLGLVRIYQRKVRYLQEDCSQSLSKMNLTFAHKGKVNLPEERDGKGESITHQIANMQESLEFAVPDPLDLDDLLLGMREDAGWRDLEAHSLDSTHSKSLDISLGAHTSKLSDITLSKDKSMYGDLDLEDPDNIAFPGGEGEFDEEPVVARHESPVPGDDGLPNFEFHTSLERGKKKKGVNESVDDISVSMGDDDSVEEVKSVRRSRRGKKGEEEEEDKEEKDTDSVMGVVAGTEEDIVFPDPVDVDAPEPEREEDDRKEQKEEDDITLPDVEDVEVLAGEKKKKKRAPVEKKGEKRKRAVELDKHTELSSAEIREGINDPSDLMGPRPTVPCTKRQKLAAAEKAKDYIERSLQPVAAFNDTPFLRNAFLRIEEMRRKIAERLEEEGEKEPEAPVEEEPVEDKERDDVDPPIELPPDNQESQVNEQEDVPMPEPDPVDPDVPPPDNDVSLDDNSVSVSFTGDDNRSHDKTGEEKEEQELDPILDDPTAEGGGKHIWRRTQKMYQVLRNELKKKKTSETSLETILGDGAARRTAAGVFYQLLVLKSMGYIDVSQPKPFGDIAIKRTPLFGKELPEGGIA